MVWSCRRVMLSSSVGCQKVSIRSLFSCTAFSPNHLITTNSLAEGITFSDRNSIFAVEIWNMKTGKFRRGAKMKIPRNYHSIALLLKDGRIVAAGGGLCNTCSANHPDAEIYTPPYLLNNDGTAATRPRIISLPSGRNIALGRDIQVTVDTSGAHTFALVRTSSVTHSVNNDQRRIPLSIKSKIGSTFTLDVPSSRNVLLPGTYFLFAMNSSGVPSVAFDVKFNVP